MSLGPQMADIIVNNQMANFNTGLYGMGTPLKIKISKIGLHHVLSWSKLGLEPKCYGPRIFGGFGKHGRTDKQTRFMFYKYRLG